MDDDAFISRLQEIFEANDPSDGIDRHDGFGTDVRVTGLRAVFDGDYPELEATYEIDVPDKRKFRNIPRTATTRVLFGREWRELSGYTTPEVYAGEVAREVWLAAGSLVEGVRERRVRPRTKRPVKPVDVLWDELMGSLRQHNVSAVEVSDGVIEVVEDDPHHVLWVRVTRDDWARFAAGRPDPLGELDEWIGSRWDAEDHIVYFRGDFHPSIRPELPPVRDPELTRPHEPVEGDWYAFSPDDVEDD